jgi:two-component system phosphate regulon response regulator PhoB
MSAAQYQVLGIDDSLTIRKLLEMVFTRAGYGFELAATGEEGLSRAKRNPPHLILLDYVLPDMKGLDVATGLAQDEKTKGIPIVLMSAKSDDLRGLFRNLPSVVEFVSKPFTPPEITFLVADLLEKRSRQAAATEPAKVEKAAEPGPSLFTHAQKETAARALFAKLRDRFAQIPDWFKSMGDASAAPYFAKKILTPELMDGLLGALAPTYQEVLGSTTRAAKGSGADAALLEGQTSIIPLTHLLKELLACGRTGVLAVEGETRRTLIYLRRGETIFATHNRPDEYARQASGEVAAGKDEIAQAEAEQRQSGKPVFVTYAAAGKFPAAELPTVLYEQGKRVLLEATSAGPAPFEWLDQSALPSYVDAYGRAYSLDQLTLERLRQVDDWAQVELHVPSLDMLFRRGEGFSTNLRRFELTDNERRVLTLVDGRNTVRHIIERSGLPTFEVFHVLFRMGQVGLVRRGEDAAALAAGAKDGRPVAILELDVDGVVEPLTQILRRRRQPIPVVHLGATEIVPALLKERPRVFLVNVSLPSHEPRALAREIRSHLEISDVPLVAVMDSEDAARPEELTAAGFDAVVVKPFAIGELEKFLAA